MAILLPQRVAVVTLTHGDVWTCPESGGEQTSRDATRGGAKPPPRGSPCSCRRRWPTPGPRSRDGASATEGGSPSRMFLPLQAAPGLVDGWLRAPGYRMPQRATCRPSATEDDGVTERVEQIRRADAIGCFE